MKTWITTPLPLFDAIASENGKTAGITKAVENKAEIVIKAREIAVEICREKGTVTLDDIMVVWVDRGGGVHDFGSSAGGILRDRRFEWTGEFVKSVRVHANCNLLRRWRLKK